MSIEGDRSSGLLVEGFESVEPPERILAELLPYRPILIDKRLHGAVTLRLFVASTRIEYVECSSRTSTAMAFVRSGQTLVLRRERSLIRRACSTLMALFAVSMVITTVLFGSLGGVEMFGWGLGVTQYLALACAATAIALWVRCRPDGSWSVMSEADWELTLAKADSMLVSGAGASAVTAMVDQAARFS